MSKPQRKAPSMAPDVDMDADLGLNGKLLQHQKESVQWMLDREKNHGKGGILADDMGLGKTYQIVALIKSNEVDALRSTLIVTVVSTVAQWQNVLMDFGNMHAYVVMAGHNYPIPQRVPVVLTTYSMFQRPTVPACLKRNWGRIVLDEGHMIKTPSSRVYKELSALIRHDQYRWVVSGTPVQNDRSELRTLLTWVGCKEGEEEQSILRRTVPQIMERFPRSFRLPPIHTRIKYLFFRYREERELYFKLSGSDLRKVMHHNAATLQILMEQRQLCVHPKVWLGDDDIESKHKLLEEKGEETPIEAGEEEEEQAFCVSNPEYDEFCVRGKMEVELFTMQKNELQHLVKSVEDSTDPPLFIPDPCDLKILSMPTAEQHAEEYDEEEEEGEEEMSEMSDDDDFPTIQDFENIEKRSRFLDLMQYESCETKKQNEEPQRFKHSTKFDYLRDKLCRDYLKRRKALVFCQWKMEMKLIGESLEEKGISYLKLDGDQNQSQRRCVLYNFDNQPDITVLIIQIRAGGVGLNLQAASRVYITAPDWNPVAELQAIARAHRINQKHRVRCTRLIMAGTVEEVNCLQKESVKLDMISECLKDGNFAKKRMGVSEEKYGRTVSRICMHFHMLEKLRDCDV